MALEKEFKYYLDHQDDLLKEHNNKHIVIIGNEVVGSFDTAGDAYMFASQKFEAGKFLIQHVTKGDESYTAQFHSRVAF